MTINFAAGLKKKKEDLESELEKLGSIREMQLKESEASGKISGLEKKIQYTEIEKVINFLFLEVLYLQTFASVTSELVIFFNIKMQFHFCSTISLRGCV